MILDACQFGSREEEPGLIERCRFARIEPHRTLPDGRGDERQRHGDTFWQAARIEPIKMCIRDRSYVFPTSISLLNMKRKQSHPQVFFWRGRIRNTISLRGPKGEIDLLWSMAWDVKARVSRDARFCAYPLLKKQVAS